MSAAHEIDIAEGRVERDFRLIIGGEETEPAQQLVERTDWLHIRQRMSAEVGHLTTLATWEDGRPSAAEIADEGFGSGC